MIFQKSSAKPLLYDFKHSLRSYLFIPAAALAFLSITFFNNFGHLRYIMSLEEKERYINYRYYFFEVGYAMGIFRLILFGLGVLVALFAFGFVNNKKMSNAFFSFNIKRSGLFVNRCVSSIIHIFAVISIPMFFNLMVNNHYLGYDSAAIYAWIYLVLAMFVYAFLGFAFAALAAVSSGSSIEAVIYTVLFYIAPFMTLFGFEMFFAKFMQGYPLTQMYNPKYIEIPWLISGRSGFINRFSIINPIAYLDNNSYDSHANFLSDIAYRAKGETLNIGISEYFPIILWAAVSALMLGIAFVVLNRRKAENAGGFGKNKISRGFAVTLCSVFAFVFASVYINLNIFVSIALAVLAFILVYFILELLIVRNFREVLGGLKKLPIVIAVMLAVFIIPFSGGFGYSKKVPSLEDIKEVYIVGPPSGNIYFLRDQSIAAGPFKSDADKEKIISIHKTLIGQNPVFGDKLKGINNGESDGFFIQYTLKDGNVLTRFFPIGIDTLKTATIDLANSDGVKAVISDLFFIDKTQEEVDRMSNDFYGYSYMINHSGVDFNNFHRLMGYYRTFGYDTYGGTHYLLGKDGALLAELNEFGSILNKTEFNDFKKAIFNDLMQLGAEKALYPEEKIIGGIWFSGNDYTQTVIDELGNPYYEYGRMGMLEYEGTTIQITESMTETIKYLKDKDLLKLFDSEKKIVAAGFIEANEDNLNKFLSAKTYYYGRLNVKRFGALYAVMDKNEKLSDDLEMVGDITKAQKLFDSAKMVYPPYKDGYFVQFAFNDNTTAILYIPKAEFPI